MEINDLWDTPVETLYAHMVFRITTTELQKKLKKEEIESDELNALVVSFPADKLSRLLENDLVVWAAKKFLKIDRRIRQEFTDLGESLQKDLEDGKFQSTTEFIEAASSQFRKMERPFYMYPQRTVAEAKERIRECQKDDDFVVSGVKDAHEQEGVDCASVGQKAWSKLEAGEKKKEEAAKRKKPPKGKNSRRKRSQQ